MKRRRLRRDLAPLNDPRLSPLQSALTAEPTSEELVGEREALTAYRAVSWERRSRHRLWRPAVLATKVGVAATLGAVSLSGVATAAYTGSLPDTLQDVAHKTIKAPKAHKSNGVGPDAKGDAAYGLCRAFAKDKSKADDEAKAQRKEAERAKERAQEQARERAAEGGSPKATPPGQAKKQDKGLGSRGNQGKERGHGKENSVAYRNLVRAAGGEGKVDAYCATIPKPSGSAEPTKAPKDKPTKSPAAKASPGAKASKPTPTAAPTTPAPTATPSASAEPTATATP